MYYWASLAAHLRHASVVAALAEAARSGAVPDRNSDDDVKWEMEEDNPSGSATVPSWSRLALPTVNADGRFCLSPDAPISTQQSASSMSPANLNQFQSQTTVNAYGYSMDLSPVILERLGPRILRARPSTAQNKQIPHNDRIDIEAYRVKDPQEWNMDDVIGWMISVAKKYQIPIEEMNMHRFANCTGTFLALMNLQNFLDRDSTYGCLLHAEFRKLIGDDTNFLDEWIRSYREDSANVRLFNAAAMPSNTRMIAPIGPPSASSPFLNVGMGNARMAAGFTFDQQCTSGQSTEPDVVAVCSIGRESVIKSTGVSAMPVNRAGSLTFTLNKPSSSNGYVENTEKRDDVRGKTGAMCNASSGSSSSNVVSGKVTKKAKSNESRGNVLAVNVKPRKRTQHSKGNKLWEFIRDALRDSSTCPAVVRWEDEREGVFRIVESEKLARLWGEKKNNQKMTYEKLSRAMRTYYEKKILVPVPKTGIYPKKLVYKFGPNANGWQQCANNGKSASSLSTNVVNKFNILSTGASSSPSFPISANNTSPDGGDESMLAVTTVKVELDDDEELEGFGQMEIDMEKLEGSDSDNEEDSASYQ